MQFLYPLGLLSLAALLVPLIIHLWNVKQGKVIKVGSIALLGESSRVSSKSFRITDLLLFILRCLLLILLALILAQPYINQKMMAKDRGGWVLFDRAVLSQVLAQHRPTIDSLIDRGYELRDFNIGFGKFELADTMRMDTAAHDVSIPQSSLIRQLNKDLPAGSSVYLFTDNRMTNSGEELPEVGFSLHWQQIMVQDTATKWFTSYAGKNYEGRSSRAATRYAAVKSSKAEPVIVLINSQSKADADYVRAAISAIAAFTDRNIQVRNWKQDGEVEVKADVGFWLSASPVHANFINRLTDKGRLFTYEQGKAKFINAGFKSSAGALASGGSVLMRYLPQRADAAGSAAHNVVWTDNFGHAVLTEETANKGLTYYRFFSRFNPQWTDVVWNEEFVKVLMPIVVGYPGAYRDFGFMDHPLDQRVVDGDKVVPKKASLNVPSERNVQQQISFPLWVLAFLILIIERTISLNKRKGGSHA